MHCTFFTMSLAIGQLDFRESQRTLRNDEVQGI